MKVLYKRLFTNADGNAEIEELSADLIKGFAVPPAEPLHSAPFLQGDGTLFWAGAEPNWNGGPAHPAPRRMIFVTIQGHYEITTPDGKVHSIQTGNVLIVEDTTGSGHSTRVTSSQDCLLLGIGLPPH